MEEIRLSNGPTAFVARMTCRIYQDLLRLGRLLGWHRRLENPIPEEAEEEEVMILMETAEVGPTDGMMMISLGIAIGDLPMDFQIGIPLGVVPPAVDLQADLPVVTLAFGLCQCVTLSARKEGRRTRSTSCRCPPSPPFAPGRSP